MDPKCRSLAAGPTLSPGRVGAARHRVPVCVQPLTGAGLGRLSPETRHQEDQSFGREFCPKGEPGFASIPLLLGIIHCAGSGVPRACPQDLGPAGCPERPPGILLGEGSRPLG